MKTEVEYLAVDVTENGKLVRRSYPIVNSEGNIMTHRLRRLLAGKLGDSQNDMMAVNVHFIGAVWHPPYTILQRLAQERRSLQDSLLILEGHNELTDYPAPIVPAFASNDKITRLVQEELKLRRKLQERLRNAHKKPYCNRI